MSLKDLGVTPEQYAKNMDFTPEELREIKKEEEERMKELSRKRIREAHHDSDQSASSGDEEEDFDTLFLDDQTVDKNSLEDLGENAPQWSMDLRIYETSSAKCQRCKKVKTEFFGYFFAYYDTKDEQDLTFLIDQPGPDDVVRVERKRAICMDCFCSLRPIRKWHENQEKEREKKRAKFNETSKLNYL